MPNKQKTSPSKELYVLALGFILIAFIMGFTLFRSDNSNTPPETQVSPASNITFKEMSFIHADELQKKLSRREPLALFDLRSVMTFELSHIPNSKNVTPESIVQSYQTITPIPDTVILIDESVETPALVAAFEQLRDANIANILILSGGYTSWDTITYPTITHGNPDSPLDASKITAISKEEAQSFRGDPEILFLDTRTKLEYDRIHLEPSINIPYAELENRHAEIPAFRKILVYGADIFGSFQSGVRLFDLGYLRVQTLNGGIEDLK